MSVTGFNSPVALRVPYVRGRIIKRATSMEVFTRMGRQEKLPKNNGKTLITRFYLPHGATNTNANSRERFFQSNAGDQSVSIVQDYQSQDGVNSKVRSLSAYDISTTLVNYSLVYGWTKDAAEQHEDDIVKESVDRMAEEAAYVNELIVWNTVKACTNKFYGGTGTSRSTVNGPLTLPVLRDIIKTFRLNHAPKITSMLSATPDVNTTPVNAAWVAYCPAGLDSNIRDLPGYRPVEEYAQDGKTLPFETGKVEDIRFCVHPDLPYYADAGAAVGTTNLESDTGSNVNVYPIVFMAEDAMVQVAMRGENVNPRILSHDQIDKSDYTGQRGYASMTWRKGVSIEHQGRIAVAEVGLYRQSGA